MKDGLGKGKIAGRKSSQNSLVIKEKERERWPEAEKQQKHQEKWNNSGDIQKVIGWKVRYAVFFPVFSFVLLYSFLCSFKLRNKGFPGDPVAKTECSQSREPRFNPWSRNQIPYTTTTKSHMPQQTVKMPCAAAQTGRSQIKKIKLGNKNSLANLFSQITDQCCNSGLHVQITHASYLTQETLVLKIQRMEKKGGVGPVFAFGFCFDGPQILQHSLVITIHSLVRIVFFLFF